MTMRTHSVATLRHSLANATVCRHMTSGLTESRKAELVHGGQCAVRQHENTACTLCYHATEA